MNDENEDTPELLAEQERLLNAVIAAEALTRRAVGQGLLVHSNKRAPSEHMTAWKGSKARSSPRSALPPFAAPEPDARSAPGPTPAAEAFSVPATPPRMASTGASCARNCARGLRAPYTLAQVEKVVGA